MSNIPMSEIAAEIGLPEIADLQFEEVANDFLPAAIAGLADGDSVLIHPRPNTDPTKIILYGEYVFNKGLVAERVRDAAIKTANNRSAVYDLQKLAADYCNLPASPFYEAFTTEQSTKIYPEAVIVDDTIIPFRKVPECVVDLTACLSSKSVIQNQIDFAAREEAPFEYVAITRMHFTNLMLMHAYDRTVGPGTANLMIQNRRYIGREDGIASTTNDMIAMQTAGGSRVDIADIILCNGAEHTTREELAVGIKNAYEMVTDEGMLIVRAFARPLPDEIGTDEIVGWACEAGFNEKTAIESNSQISNPGTQLLRPQPEVRQMKTLVLSKS